MDANSVSHMMHSEHLISDSDYEAITAAPTDINMNCLLLQYVRAMDVPDLFKFSNLLKSIDTHHCIGVNLEKCMYVSHRIVSLHVSKLFTLAIIIKGSLIHNIVKTVVNMGNFKKPTPVAIC